MNGYYWRSNEGRWEVRGPDGKVVAKVKSQGAAEAETWRRNYGMEPPPFDHAWSLMVRLWHGLRIHRRK